MSEKEKARKQAWREKNREVIRQKHKEWRDKNKEKYAETSKTWLANNREVSREIKRKWADNNKEAAAASSKRWSNENKDRRAKTSQQWRVKNKDRLANMAAAWKASNRIRVAANEHKRRARLRNAPGSFTKADIAVIFEEQGGVCICGTKLAFGFHMDHVQPLAKGGDNWPTNIQLLCPNCNFSKGAKTLSEWKSQPHMELKNGTFY